MVGLERFSLMEKLPSKKVFYDRDGLRLEPANEEYDDILIRPDVFEEVRVLGRYVGHVNRTGIFRQSGRALA